MDKTTKNSTDMQNSLVEHKICSKCKRRYPSTSDYFYKNKNRKLGLDAWCKNCKSDYDHKRHKIYRYGISLNKVNELIIEQKNRCAICGQFFDDIFNNYKDKITIRSPRVDHNHKSGKIRGILCNRCNILLGMVKDNTSILLEAANYLDREKNLDKKL